jgi:hypothetical protein
MLLWQADPKVTSTAGDETVRVVKDMLESAGTQRLRSMTVHDWYAAGYAALALRPRLEELLRGVGPARPATTVRVVDGILGDLAQQRAALASVGVSAGTVRGMAVVDQVRLMTTLSAPAVRSLLALVGRLDHVSGLLRPGGSPEPALELSARLEDMTAAQMASLVKPLRLEFLARVADAQLETVGRHHVPAPGPVVLCLDSSASMDQPYAGSSRQAWSKALATAVVKEALAQNRPVVVILFASTGHNVVLKMDMRDGHMGTKMVTMVETFLGGGTDFASAMELAAQQVIDFKTKGEADVIFVTDTECRLTTPQLARIAADKALLRMAVRAVTFGDGGLPFADTTHLMSDFMDSPQNGRSTHGRQRSAQVACTRKKVATCP